MGSKYQLAKWLHGITQPKGTPYDTKYRRALWRLRKQGLVRVQHNCIELTPEAYHFLESNKRDIEQLTIQRQDEWDGYWRMVIWDILERKRSLRDAFRSRLTELGFVRIQGSIWVTPHPCKKQIQQLRAAYGLAQENVLFVTARFIEGQERLKKHFQLEKPPDQHNEQLPPPYFLKKEDAKLVRETADSYR